MKISLNWLQDYVELKKGVTVDDIAWRISESVAEVETIENFGDGLAHVVVAKIEKITSHPNADKLKLCQVSTGAEKHQIVCGGTNIFEGMLAPLAMPGACVKWHGKGDPITLEKAKIRGEESYGMLATSEELSLEKLFPLKVETEIMDLTKMDVKVGETLAKALELSDTVLHIENHAITHRPDLFSQKGFAREFVALGLATWKHAVKMEKIPEGSAEIPFSITSKDKTLWSHYQGIVVSGLRATASPLWLRKRLAAVGTRSINLIVDITNYVMWESGMPTHAFDMKKIHGTKWITRLSRKDEKVKTLDGVERTMQEGLIVIENDKKVIDLCGVMGGENSGISDDTTDVFFHAVAYEPSRIRKAMMQLGHRTDAGTIFEKGIDPELPEEGMDQVLRLVAKLAPNAKLSSKRFVKKNFKMKPQKVKLTASKIKSLLGVELDAKMIAKTLKDLGCEVKSKVSKKDAMFDVMIPSHRMKSLTCAEDLIEEIIRVYSYSKLPETLPAGSIMPPIQHPLRMFARKIREALSVQGFNEEQNLSFLSKALIDKIEWKDESLLLSLANPVSEDFAYMRPSLLPYLLHNGGRNYRLKLAQKSYELQKVFVKDGNNVKELWMCVGVVPEVGGVLAAKGAIESLEMALGLCFDFVETQDVNEGHPGKSLMVKCGEKTVGKIYELKASIARNFDLPVSVGIFELSIDAILDQTSQMITYKPLSRFPTIDLDVSVAVDKAVRAQEVWRWITSIEPSLLKNIQLKDVYEGASVGEGKKSLMYNMLYQAADRTLSEEEIQGILKKIVSVVELNGGVVRK